MATCHSLRMIDGELIGDPLDVKMFEFTNWSYEEGSHNTAEVYEDYENISPSVARSPLNFVPWGDAVAANVSLIYFKTVYRPF